MSRKHLWILVVSVLAIVAISAGAVDAAKGGKPGKPPPEPDPSANPEIVCDLRIKNKGYLAVMGADGSNVTPLYSGSAHWGTWSPDGQYIAVKNNVNPRYQLWRMDADGSNPEYLTHPITDRPRWSPGSGCALGPRRGC